VEAAARGGPLPAEGHCVEPAATTPGHPSGHGGGHRHVEQVGLKHGPGRHWQALKI